MFGVIIFWLHYIIAGILLYHILRCIYVKQKTSKSIYNATYERTSEDKRLKHPLWLVLLFILAFCIPIINILSFGIYLTFRMVNESGSTYNPYYCKSIFTKEY
jgi:uncharacterized membrane protein